MTTRLLSHEQPISAHTALRRGGVRHGQSTPVVVAVGLLPGDSGEPRLAFCSAVVKAGKVPRDQRAPWWTRCQPITGDIEVADADQLVGPLQGKTGIAVLHGTVFCNGHVRFQFDPAKTTVVPVDRHQASSLRHTSGQTLAKKALATVS